MNKKSLLKLLEFSSLIAFGVGYFRWDFQVATMAMMAAMTIFVGASVLLRESLSRYQWLTWVIVVGLGALTLLSRDEQFLKWKITVINFVLAAAVLLSHWIGDKTLLQRCLPANFYAPEPMLRRVNAAVGVYFCVLAAINVFIVMYMDTRVWVQFKLFGVLGLNFVFLLGAFYYLREYIQNFMEKK